MKTENSNRELVRSDDGQQRVMAFLVARELTDEELDLAAGGGNKTGGGDCTGGCADQDT